MKNICNLLVIMVILSTGVEAQSIYRDSLRTTYSINTSFSNAEHYNSFGIGGVLSLAKGIDIGLLISSHNEKNAPEFRQNRDGKGWGGFLSLLVMNENKGSPFGTELAFIFNKQKYSQSYSDYQFESEAAGFGVNFSKKKELSPTSFVLPQVNLNLFLHAKARETESSRSNYAGYKFSTFNFIAAIAKKLNTFVIVLEPGVSYNSNSKVFAGSFGITLFSR